jgi:hypothetical protein
LQKFYIEMSLLCFVYPTDPFQFSPDFLVQSKHAFFIPSKKFQKNMIFLPWSWSADKDTNLELDFVLKLNSSVCILTALAIVSNQFSIQNMVNMNGTGYLTVTFKPTSSRT